MFLSICFMHNGPVNILVGVEVILICACFSVVGGGSIFFFVYLGLNTSKILSRTPKVYTPISSSCFSAFLSTMNIQLFNFLQIWGAKTVCNYCLSLHYLITNKIENILMCLWVILVSYFVKCLSICIVHFLAFSG